MNTGCKIIDIEVRGESRIEGQEKIKKIESSSEEVWENLERKSSDYTISHMLIRCYIQNVWKKYKILYLYHSRKNSFRKVLSGTTRILKNGLEI